MGRGPDVAVGVPGEVAVYLYSRWAVAEATPGQIEEVVSRLTSDDLKPIDDGSGGQVWSRFLDFADSAESDWEQSSTSGTRWTGLAVIPGTDGEYLVGVLATTQAMSISLGELAATAMSQTHVPQQPASFSLRTLMDPAAEDQGVAVTSVRLHNSLGEIVLLSAAAADLRAQMDQVAGDLTGVTFETGGVRLTAYGDDTLVFNEPRNVLQPVVAVQSLGFTLQTPDMVS